MLFIIKRRKQLFLKTAACLGCLLLLMVAACGGSPASPTPSPSPNGSTQVERGEASPTQTSATASPLSTDTQIPSASSTPNSPNLSPGEATRESGEASPSPTALPTDFWQSLPVIPTQISARTREIYRSGLAIGNNPHVFSRIGDCASAAPAFLVGFDGKPNLGDYASLQPAIDYYQGSFKRPSIAAKNGLNSAGLLSTLWTGEQCLKNESLLDCQYRLDRPSFALISIGTNEAYYVHVNPESFEHNMRIIIDDTIGKGIVPILGTKADDVEGDGSINATIARLAMEYEIPLWNFWLAAQPLPNHGMVEPEHLSSVSYANFTDFTIPNSLEYGMQVRNLTALQMLNLLREQLAEEP
jgi:hypothetical protein